MHHSRHTAKLTSKRDFELDLCSKAWALEKHKANNGGLFASKAKPKNIIWIFVGKLCVYHFHVNNYQNAQKWKYFRPTFWQIGEKSVNLQSIVSYLWCLCSSIRSSNFRFDVVDCIELSWDFGSAKSVRKYVDLNNK